jgi:hypothetical protein
VYEYSSVYSTVNEISLVYAHCTILVVNLPSLNSSNRFVNVKENLAGQQRGSKKSPEISLNCASERDPGVKSLCKACPKIRQSVPRDLCACPFTDGYLTCLYLLS